MHRPDRASFQTIRQAVGASVKPIPNGMHLPKVNVDKRKPCMRSLQDNMLKAFQNTVLSYYCTTKILAGTISERLHSPTSSCCMLFYSTAVPFACSAAAVPSLGTSKIVFQGQPFLVR